VVTPGLRAVAANPLVVGQVRDAMRGVRSPGNHVKIRASIDS